MCSIGIMMHIVCISCMYVYWGEISHSAVEILCLYPANSELRSLAYGSRFRAPIMYIHFITDQLELEPFFGCFRCYPSLRDV